jgi:hypothetical protein
VGRRYAGFEREQVDTVAISLESLPKLVRVRMVATTDEIKKLKRAAQRHLKSG